MQPIGLFHPIFTNILSTSTYKIHVVMVIQPYRSQVRALEWNNISKFCENAFWATGTKQKGILYFAIILFMLVRDVNPYVCAFAHACSHVGGHF